MQAYKLDSEPDSFQAYLLEDVADCAVFDQAYGKPQGARWQPVCVVPERESRRRKPPGDCPCLFLGSNVLALSQHAVEVLRDLLEPFGEFLSLDCDEEPLWIYNCTRFIDVLDEPASDILRFSDGSIMHIRRHMWRPGVEVETAFRLPQLHRSSVYVTDRVVERIHSAGLRGFDLSQP